MRGTGSSVEQHHDIMQEEAGKEGRFEILDGVLDTLARGMAAADYPVSSPST